MLSSGADGIVKMWKTFQQSSLDGNHFKVGKNLCVNQFRYKYNNTNMDDIPTSVEWMIN
jgi:hypothetical protein